MKLTPKEYLIKRKIYRYKGMYFDCTGDDEIEISVEQLMEDYGNELTKETLRFDQIHDYLIKRWNNGLTKHNATMDEIREEMTIVKKMNKLSESIKWD